jgi:hypothetical protein
VDLGVAGTGLGDPRSGDGRQRRSDHGRGGSGTHRRRVCGRVPRGGRGAPDRRAVRHARPRRRGHGHRGGADRLGHDRGRSRQGGARARHGVRRRHDRLQRDRWIVPPSRRRTASRAGLPGRGSERRAGRAGRTHHPHPHRAQRHDQRGRPDVQHSAARLRRNDLAGAVRLVRLRPDCAAPRLFPSARRRRRGDPRGAALQDDGAGQCRPAARHPDRRRGPRQGAHPDPGGGGEPAECAEGRGRGRDRRAGPVARGAGGAASSPGQPAADDRAFR